MTIQHQATDRSIAFHRPEIIDADLEAVRQVLESGWITTGEQCLGLERDLEVYLGSDTNVVAVSSCTAALEILLASLHLPAGSRVGVPAWTFVSTATVAVHVGATPVLLDVSPEDLNISATSLQAALARGLDAVVVVHYAGVPVSADIYELCARAGVPVIEDAAHALGTTDHRGPIRGLGSVGAAFSFYATKNLTSAEGGAIATGDAALAEFSRSYRQHGMSRDAWARYRPNAAPSYDIEELGIKANMPDVLAALARSQLRRFPEMQRVRRVLVDRYRSGLADSEIAVIPSAAHPGSADHLVPVALPTGLDREGVIAGLRGRGVSTSIHFRPLHRFRAMMAAAEVGPGGLANADAMADRVLSLPLHTLMSVDDVDYVCQAFHDVVREQRR